MSYAGLRGDAFELFFVFCFLNNSICPVDKCRDKVTSKKLEIHNQECKLR